MSVKWKVHSLQAVWWTNERPNSVSDLYQKITDVKPAATQEQQGTAIATGQLGDRFIRVQMAANRLDLIESPFQVTADLPLFENYQIARDSFARRSRQLKIKATRLAVVVVLCSMAENTDDAYKIASDDAGVISGTGKYNDFIFQVNRPQEDANPKYGVNRILRWSSENVQNIDMSSGFPIVRHLNFASVSLDVNIVPKESLILEADEVTAGFELLQTSIDKLYHGPRKEFIIAP